jgi:anthraniloyl-CoA monooxygenase
MGSTRPLDAFSFFFEETEHGIFIAHAYQYARDASTWIFECRPDTFERAGLTGSTRPSPPPAWPRSSPRRSTATADHQPLDVAQLSDDPHPRWVKDNVVLLGDAKATAHFSIGSGTKLAIEDAIACSRASGSTRM